MTMVWNCNKYTSKYNIHIMFHSENDMMMLANFIHKEILERLLKQTTPSSVSKYQNLYQVYTV